MTQLTTSAKPEAGADIEPLHFSPAARLQRFLGRELIADPNLAIGEFVKNGYDAGATRVVVEFEVAGALPEHLIRISDDGVGMTYSEFRENWMKPGYSQKVGRRTTKSPSEAKTAHQRVEARLPIGEKGIGRLAAGRLGDVLHVWTRKRKSDPWLHVPFYWGDFDDMNKPLDQVPVTPDLATPPPVDWPEVGTVLEISELSLNWTGRVPGRRVAGRHPARLGRLRQDLELIVSPLAATEQHFEIELRSSRSEDSEFTGLVVPADLRLLDYRYDFEITKDAKRGVRVQTRVRRAEDFAREIGRDESTTKTEYYGPGADPDADPTLHPATLECGDIRGTMFYAARKGTANRLHTLGIQPGVHVYRDGIRVEPYGDLEDDWLGVQARKASRQGYAAIRPNFLYGFVQISKITNPELVDMTNRQGLVENQAYDEFVSHMRAEFRRFANIVFDEFVEPDWTKDEERASALATHTVNARDVLIRDIVHDLRQPVASLGTEMRNLDYVLENYAIPAKPKALLTEIRDRSSAHLDDIAAVVRIALELPASTEIEPVSVRDVVEEAVAAVINTAATHGAVISADVGDRIVLARREHFRRAITELIRNAVQASRDGSDTPTVRLTTSSEEGNVILRIADNGTGVDAGIAGDMFSKPISRHGRQGEGLISVRDLLATFTARARLANPGEAGAIFEVVIPSMGEVRRMLR